MRKTIVFLHTVLLLFATVLFAGCTQTEKTTEIVRCTLPEKNVEIVAFQVGDPDFPFGATHARLTLYVNREEVKSVDFDVKHDGKNLGSTNFDVEWLDESVIVSVNGEEQKTETFEIRFDGKTE